MKLIVNILVATIITIISEAKIMRNNALMSKMVSNFQKDNNLSTDSPDSEVDNKITVQQNPEKVISLMQTVLCKNYPSIPCDMITNDKTLNKLIQRSIQQINYKKMTIDKTTQAPTLKLFPMANSEELSNFLKIRDSGYYSKQKRKHKKLQVIKGIQKPPEHIKTKRKEVKQTAVYNGRKKLRKFYPHKVKKKDKKFSNNFEYSGEKLSMSVEDPEVNFAGKRQRFSYKVEPENAVWRIDYTKHGEPNINFVNYDEGLKAKTGTDMIAGEVVGQGTRNDVMHPDLYIKKKFKKSVLQLHSEGID